jgi:hypothetical protein
MGYYCQTEDSSKEKLFRRDGWTSFHGEWVTKTSRYLGAHVRPDFLLRVRIITYHIFIEEEA